MENAETVSNGQIISNEAVNNNLSQDKALPPDNSNLKPQTVPYILNGELYEILARNGENVTVKCCSCPSGRFYRGSVRSTGNFHMHIKRRHPYLLGKLHDMKVHSLLERRDRLMRNRKAKLRRVFVNNKDEHEMHKLKIKRAFQRHQAEAKVHKEQDITQEGSGSTDIKSQDIPKESVINFSCNNNSNNNISIESKIATTNAVGLCNGNTYGNLNIYEIHNSPQSMEMKLAQAPTPAVTPYPSTYEGSTFGDQSPLAFPGFKNVSYDTEHPLDLSCNIRSSSPSTAANISHDSGVGLGPLLSETTITNTISTAGVFPTQSDCRRSSISDSGDVVWWQQSLTFMLRDIRNDIRSRNRIEHNRLLLEVAKFKFLHPGFYFNYQA